MKNITVLDMNVILRYLLNDHPQHFELAQTLMKKVIAGETTVYIPDSVLAAHIERVLFHVFLLNFNLKSIYYNKPLLFQLVIE